MRSGGGARPRSRSPGSSGSSSSRSAGSSDGIGTAKPGGRRLSSRPEPFSSSRPGRSPSCLQAEMRQEVLAGAVGDRPARHLAAAARLDPAGLHQHVEGALRHHHAADFLDLGAGHRLVVGDDGERLDRGARQLLRDHRFLGEQPRQIARGAEGPLVADADEVDAARGIFRLQRAQAALRSTSSGSRAPSVFSSSGTAAANSSASSSRRCSGRTSAAAPPISRSARALSSSWGMMRRSAKAAMPPNLLAFYSVARGIAALELTAASAASSRLRR